MVSAPADSNPLFAQAKPVSTKRRQRTVAAELPRFEAVCSHAAFQADPLTAVCNHLNAALASAPSGKKREETRKAEMRRIYKPAADGHKGSSERRVTSHGRGQSGHRQAGRGRGAKQH